MAWKSHIVAMAGDSRVDHLEPDELPLDPEALLVLEDVAADEIAFVELDDPAEPGLQRGCRGVDFIAVETHPGLEAQCVPGAETGGHEALFSP